MKTLNKEKSEELYARIENLNSLVDIMLSVVANPDEINETNCAENYKIYDEAYKGILLETREISAEVFRLHLDIIHEKLYENEIKE